MTLIDTKTGDYFRQQPPNAIQVEMLEGCNLRCTFCGLNGIRGKERVEKKAAYNTLKNIAYEIERAGWKSRIEFAMHGEPTLHPRIVEVVRMFRHHLPNSRLMITTNGVPLTRHLQTGAVYRGETRRDERLDEEAVFHANAEALFDAGLTVLALDEYQGIVKPAAAARTFVHPGVLVVDYPDDRRGNPHGPRAHDERVLTVIRNIAEETKGTHAVLNNHAGAGAPRNDNAQGKRCAKPFRELSFRWDGSVAVCCNDWRGEYVIGNINQMSIEEIWHHPRFDAIRKALYHGQRTTSPCAGCDALSYRPGLLPDRLGKVDLAEPDEEDLRQMGLALADGPLTAPVWRPWETGRLLPVIVAGQEQ